jgi:hypothetical protein
MRQRLRSSILLAGITLMGCGQADLTGFRTTPRRSIRLVLFGDSDTDYGFAEPLALKPDERIVATSYVSTYASTRLSPDAPHNAWQLAGMIVKGWSGDSLEVVNHAIGGTNSGFGTSVVGGGPNARDTIKGVTRFEAEVLGKAGTTWTANGIARVHAFTPTPSDFAYVSLGTNDCRYNLTYAETIQNLKWMAETWIAQGLPANHFLLATIPPTADTKYCPVLDVNANIRALGKALGLQVIDIGAYTTTDGMTWTADSMSVDPPEDVHYRAWVRRWVAGQILSAVDARLNGTLGAR